MYKRQEEILRELMNTPFRLKVGEKTVAVKPVRARKIPLQFRVSSDLHGLTVVAMFPKEFRPLLPSCSFALVGENVVAVEEQQRGVLRVLYQEQLGGQCSFDYPVREAARVMGELVPFLKLTGLVEISDELRRQLIQLPLVARVYLDRSANGRDVVARAQFRYGDRTIDPFDETPLPENLPRGEKLLLRDAAAERKVLDALGAAGFIVSKGHVYLTGQEAIFNFVSEGLQHLQELAEVYLSNDFKRMTPRKPKFAGKMRLNGSALELKFTQDDEPAQEILAIMEALARRRRYFRLKDGSFLDLSAMDEWLPLADSIFEAAQAEGAESVAMGDDTIRLQAYRACYLQSLLESLGLPIEVDEKTQATVRLLTDPGKVQDVKLPDGLSPVSYTHLCVFDGAGSHFQLRQRRLAAFAGTGGSVPIQRLQAHDAAQAEICGQNALERLGAGAEIHPGRRTCAGNPRNYGGTGAPPPLFPPERRLVP